MISAIVHENSTRLRIDGDAVDIVEITWPFVVRRSAFLAPIEKELSILVELRNASSVITIGHKQRAVGQPGQKRRPIEVSSIGAADLRRSDRLHEFLAIVSEFI